MMRGLQILLILKVFQGSTTSILCYMSPHRTVEKMQDLCGGYSLVKIEYKDDLLTVIMRLLEVRWFYIKKWMYAKYGNKKLKADI